jgi:hypothetical protein
MAGHRLFVAWILLPLALAACQKRGSEHDTASATTAAAGTAGVPCALHGTGLFDVSCPVERIVSGNGLMLVIHHPDGGFRRLQVTTDGRGVVTADGSEGAMVSVVNPGTIEVAVGDDRYRLPATVQGQPLPAK